MMQFQFQFLIYNSKKGGKTSRRSSFIKLKKSEELDFGLIFFSPKKTGKGGDRISPEIRTIHGMDE